MLNTLLKSLGSVQLKKKCFERSLTTADRKYSKNGNIITIYNSCLPFEYI